MITIFLGAGCSLPSGQPSTDFLTNEVLNGTYYIEGDSFYNLFLPNAIIQDKSVVNETNLNEWYFALRDEYQIFIKYLYNLKSWKSKPTYEDLSGFILNVLNYNIKNHNDIFVYKFINGKEFNDYQYDIMRQLNFNFRLDDCYIKFYKVLNNIIDWIIVRNIKNIIKPNGYDFLFEIINKFKDSRINIATTNYDLNIENILASKGIKFDYCFQGIDLENTEGFKWRIGNKFKVNHNKDKRVIPILKLHGSINWFDLYNTSDYDKFAFGIPEDTSLNFSQMFKSILKIENQHIKPITAPRILHGSMYKVYSYLYSLHIDLITEFNQCLKNSKALIITGTSFNDTGINPSFNQFINDPNRKKIVIIEPFGSKAYINIYKVFGNEIYFNGLVREKVIMQVDNYPCNLSSIEIESIYKFVTNRK